MIELVSWSCALGFSPIVLFIGWRIIATAMGLACWAAIRPPPSSTTTASPAVSARTGSTPREDSAMAIESVHDP